MSTAGAECRKHLPCLMTYDRRARKQHRRVEVALQGHILSDPSARGAKVNRPSRARPRRIGCCYVIDPKPPPLVKTMLGVDSVPGLV